ncbi:MAG: MFS transporter, partial [Acidimicrobiia bacterium]
IPPAILAVVALAWLAHDVPHTGEAGERPRFALRPLGRPFIMFLLIVGVFDLGNSSDAFLVLRAQERGLSVVGVLAMLASFNLIYALISTPAGSWSDRIGRRKIIIGGWVAYAIIYFGFGLAQTAWQIWMLYAVYGLYYGLAYGTAKALVADLVPAHLRGTAYGTYNATLGILDFPASAIAGVLWQGVGGWQGFGPSAPFIFGGTLALLAALMLGISDIGRGH